MDQPELGKNEEHPTPDPSSAKLPETEQASSSEAPPQDDIPVEPATEVDAEPMASTDDDVTETDVEIPSESPAPEAPADASSDAGGSDETAETSADKPADNGLRRGMLVEGAITSTSPTAVNITIDLDGETIEGVVPGRELELMTKRTLESLVEGAQVTVYVVNPRNHRGNTILSINQALEELDWRTAEEYRENKSVYDGKIGGYNKGGLIVRFGQLRGFVPQSQIADSRLRRMKGETPEERYGKMVNEDISVKVMEVERSRNRLILSERAAMREVRQRRKEALITELQVGEERDGVVVSLENFGAFVDIGGAEGLVHITEISWKHITHPRQALNVGDDVRVRVISVDPDQNRIGLSIKALLPDPWDEIRAEYGEGALVRATVTKLTKFGAFARIHGEVSVEGLIHISELAENRVEHPRDIVKRNDEIVVRIIKVDVKNRRLGLSIKQVNSAAFLDVDMDRAFREAAIQRLQQAEAETSTGEAAEETESEAPDTTEDALATAEVTASEAASEETASEEVASNEASVEADDVVAEDESLAGEAPADEAPADEATEDNVAAEATIEAESNTNGTLEDEPVEATVDSSDDTES